MTEEPCDVLVVGAGIYGATLACVAARSGLRVTLIDKADFGGEASANSLKILHGGLRYLQQLNLPRMRESIRARRDGLASLSYLAHPATFVVPTGSTLKRSRLAYRVAACLNDLVSADRNRDVPASHHVPPTAVWNREQLDHAMPGAELSAEGALVWSDGLIENTERFTLAYIMSARDAGARILNYTRAVSLLQTGNRVEGIVAQDEEGREFDLRARMTINTTGGWLSSLSPRAMDPHPTRPLVKAFNIVVNRNWFGTFGVGLDNQERNYFFAPWRGGTMIGTEYLLYDGNPDDCHLTPKETSAFVQHVNEVYPAAGLNVNDIIFAHVGLLPAATDRAGRPIPLPSGKTEVTDFQQRHNVEGLIAISGVKYTTATHWAGVLNNLIHRHLGRHKQATANQALYGAEAPVQSSMILRDARAAGWMMRHETADWMSRHYGARYPELIELFIQDQALGETLPDSPIPTASIVHGVTSEQARHLDDIVFRRTDLGTFGHPGERALSKAGDVMAGLCKWDTRRTATERARVKTYYERLGLHVKS